MNINLNFFTFFIQKFSDICKKKKLANPQHPSGLPAFANAHSPRYAAVCKCLQPSPLKNLILFFSKDKNQIEKFAFV